MAATLEMVSTLGSSKLWNIWFKSILLHVLQRKKIISIVQSMFQTKHFNWHREYILDNSETETLQKQELGISVITMDS